MSLDHKKKRKKRLGQASKNGGVVHPFFQNARPIFITPKKIKKMKKLPKRGGPTRSLSN
jgi:hypothetical protein